MAQPVVGVIVNYRVDPKSQKPKECLIKFSHIKSVSDASRLIGRKVAWKNGENKSIGRIVALHGKKGLLRARFRRGVPGQAIGKTVELVG